MSNILGRKYRASHNIHTSGARTIPTSLVRRARYGRTEVANPVKDFTASKHTEEVRRAAILCTVCETPVAGEVTCGAGCKSTPLVGKDLSVGTQERTLNRRKALLPKITPIPMSGCSF